MRNFGRAFAAALLIVIQFGAVEAKAGPALDQALGAHCAGSTCTIASNPGGDLNVFAQAAQEVLAEGKHLRIAGMCASACVLLADFARANTCITPAALFAVHKTYLMQIFGPTIASRRGIPDGRLIARNDPPQSPDLDGWIRNHGGYPTQGVNIIPLKAAKLFWAMCK